MKTKYKIGEAFDCYGNIIVIIGVTAANYKPASYKPNEHLYKFMFLHKSSSNILNAWPFFVNYDDSDLDGIKKIEL